MIKKIALAVLINLLLWMLIMSQVVQFPKTQLDMSLGVRYEPYARIVSRTEGFAVNRTNNFGFIDLDFSIPSDNVLVLGNSLVAAVHVPIPDNFSSVLERQLIQNGQAIKVHNLGMPGRHVADYIQYGSAYLDTFDPIYVIVLIGLRDIDQAFEQRPNGTNAYIDTNSRIHAPEQFSKFYVLKNHWIGLHALTYNIYERLASYARNLMQDNRKKTLSGPDSSDPDPFVRIVIVLDALKDVYGEKLLLAFYEPLTLEEQFTGQMVPREHADHEAFFFEYVESESIPIIKLTPVLLSCYGETGKIPIGFANKRPGRGHANRIGHAVIGQTLSQFLLDRLHEPTDSIKHVQNKETMS